MAKTPIFDRSDMILDRSVASALLSYTAASNGGDDSAAINAFLTAKGANAAVQFDKREQYVTSGGITALTGQTIIGLNLKRANKLESAITSSFVCDGSVSQVDVADPALFAIGDKVTVSYGLHLALERTVAGKSGSTIILNGVIAPSTVSTYGTNRITGGTESGSWKQSDGVTALGTVSSGAYLTKTFKTITLAADCTLDHCVIDGNKANWEAGYTGAITWDRHAEIEVAATALARVKVLNSILRDFAGECLVETGGTTSVSGAQTASAWNAPGWVDNYGLGIQWLNEYSGNSVLNGGGNGFHLSSVNGVRVARNLFDNLNQNINVGHVDGAIALSWSGRDVTIESNTIRRAHCGVSPLYIPDHSYCKIAFNTFIRCKQYAIKGHLSSYNMTDLHLIGNVCVDCGIKIYGASTGFVRNLQAMGNTVYGSVTLGNIAGGSWIGGKVDMRIRPPVEIVSSNTITATTADVVLPAGQYYGAFATPTTTVGYSTGVFQVGDQVILTQRGTTPKISGITTIKTVGGTVAAPVYTLTGVDTTFVTGAAAGGGDGTPVFIHSAEYRSTTVATADIPHNSTNSVTVRDPSLFVVGDYLTTGQVSTGSRNITNNSEGQENASRVTAVDYATGALTFADTLTINGAVTITAGTGTSEIRVQRMTQSDVLQAFGIYASKIKVDTEIYGGAQNLRVFNTSVGTTISGSFSDGRTIGILEGSGARGVNIENARVRTHSQQSASFYNGIQSSGYTRINNVEITIDSNVTSGGGGACLMVSGTASWITNATLRSLGTGYTLNTGTVDRAQMSYQVWARNNAGATGENGATGVPAATSTITLLPTV